MEFEYSPRTQELQKQLLQFMDEHIYPAEQRYEDEIEANTKAGKRWTPLQTIEELKPKARVAGTLEHVPAADGGRQGREGERSRLRPVEPRLRAAVRDHGPRAVVRPRSSTARRPTPATWRRSSATAPPSTRSAGCSRCSTARSGRAFAMTEPAVASSDATNIEAQIGATATTTSSTAASGGPAGAGDPRCKIFIVMGKTDSDAPRHSQQSMVLVPADTPGRQDRAAAAGVRLRRRAARPHGGRRSTTCACPPSNILLGEGRGFEIAQGRLGPGRIHHCMRADRRGRARAGDDVQAR